jgi:hypothetical protein
MRTRLLLVGWTLVAVSSAAAQRRVRVGPVAGIIGLEDAAGRSHRFTGFGGSAALITGDDGETGLSVARYSDLSTDGRVRRLTLYALDSHYYPVGTRGIAPFAATELGLARVTESATLCPLLCSDTLSTTSQIALAFGLGVRVNVGNDAVGLIEGRFLQVPGSQIQALEGRANVSIALGSPRTGEFTAGTLGPTVSYLIPVSGPLQARSPFVGVRFRRDTKKPASSVGLQIDFAPLKVTGSCAGPGCRPTAILFAAAYEAGVRPPWGRVYGELGFLLAGFYTEGPDRGIAQGLHGGIGCDVARGPAMWNFNAHLLWFQRNSGENVFGVQVGASVSPKLGGKER